tara:strand:- start:69 stop:821 length:753 start_codon:yes stop_codon:yes gene_type:complete
MSKGIVLSLFDYTAEALKPWAAAGYECHAFDIQHVDAEPTFENTQFFAGGGSISYLHADLHDFNTHKDIFMRFDGRKVVLGMAWPVCTDMAVSGAAWFASKAKADPNFQTKAVNHATICADLFDALGVPYMIENPVSVLATKWRKPDHTFHPYEFGEYIPEDQGEHPRWPEYIAPFDAYTKKTCLWTGGGYKMPPKLPTCKPVGYSTQHKKLGGKSKKTKDIRSATPRGFAIANFLANQSSTINRSGPQT